MENLIPAKRQRATPQAAETVIRRLRPALPVHDGSNVVTLTRWPIGKASGDIDAAPVTTARGFATGVGLASVFWLLAGIAIWLLARG